MHVMMLSVKRFDLPEAFNTARRLVDLRRTAEADDLDEVVLAAGTLKDALEIHSFPPTTTASGRACLGERVQHVFHALFLDAGKTLADFHGFMNDFVSLIPDFFSFITNF